MAKVGLILDSYWTHIGLISKKTRSNPEAEAKLLLLLQTHMSPLKVKL
ncbi:hypothetical protein SAMN04489864_101118 [Pedobacter insulae]|uniref:Uncharacterized protein n=1 Tax=Pedobacter insulae TaxID=414048 RepID=A0A1I2SYM6_9SPHI|nr:hypothetical protein SAMN04489864_101118 [Pedobacter insulae]